MPPTTLFASLMMVEKALKMPLPILGCSAYAPRAATHHRGQHGERARVLTLLPDWRGKAFQVDETCGPSESKFCLGAAHSAGAEDIHSFNLG